MAYNDAAIDRANREFFERVQAARLAQAPNKIYRRWHQQFSARLARPQALSDRALEAAIMGLAARFPDNVIRGTTAA